MKKLFIWILTAFFSCVLVACGKIQTDGASSGIEDGDQSSIVRTDLDGLVQDNSWGFQEEPSTGVE